MAVKQSTRKKAILMIDNAIENNTLTSTDTGTLRGKTRFILSFTQAGRGALAPLTKRQCALRYSDKLAADLRGSLKFMKQLLLFSPLALEVRMEKSCKPPTLVWSDGSFQPALPPCYGRGEIGFVVLYRSSWMAAPKIFFGSHIIKNDWCHEVATFRSQKTFILPIETAGIAAVYFAPELETVLYRQDVIHFGDNQAANGASIKGYSSADDANHIANNIHIQTHVLQIRLWIEDVRSKSNIGDDPSRGALERLQTIPRALQARFQALFGGSQQPVVPIQQVRLVMPPVRAWQ